MSELIKELKIAEVFKPLMQSNPLINPYISLPGGRNSAKSFTVGVKAILRAMESPIKILFAREYQNSIQQSSYQVLVDTIARLGLEKFFVVNKTEIIGANGSKIFFKGLKTNVGSIKSFEDVSLCVVEEAENVSQESWDALIPTIRAEGSQIIVIFNPSGINSPTYQQWVVNPLPGTLVIHSTYKDNAFLTEKSKLEIEAMKESDPTKYRNIYLGEPISEDDQAIIRLEWFEAVLDAHKRLNFDPEGLEVIGFDAADGGKDNAAVVHRHGSVVRHIEEFIEQDLKAGVRKVYSYCKKEGISLVNYDVIGIGVGAKPHFEAVDPEGKIKLTPFDARKKASTEMYKDTHKCCDYFKNARSENCIKLADRFHKTWLAVKKGAYIDPDELISIDTDLISDDIIDKLRLECTNIREKPLSNYRTIESKDEMKKRGLKSPNIFDALYIAFSPVDTTNQDTVQLNFTPYW